MASDSLARGSAEGENPKEWARRQEQMRLRPMSTYGPKFFVKGFKPSKEVCLVCDRLKVWCSCDVSKI